MVCANFRLQFLYEVGVGHGVVGIDVSDGRSKIAHLRQLRAAIVA